MSRLLLCWAALALLLPPPPAAWAAEAGQGLHQWPVDPAEVLRGFEVGDMPWAAGHRGVDLAATNMTEVRATADGRIVFAGAVAGVTWVTVLHDGDLRTSFGPVTDVAVQHDQLVRRGQRLATAAPGGAHNGLHWSARRGSEYLDPLDLVRAVLVPMLVGPGGTWPSGLYELPGYEPWDGRDRTFGFLPGTRTAEEPGWVHAPNPNHVVAVAGLLTSTGSTPLPVTHLGYAADHVTNFSHAGLNGDDQLPYGPQDTFLGVDRAARLLGEQLRAQWAREPGVAVDLVGHSLGGVVVLHYLLAHHDPADPRLPPIAHVVTLASPLQGADLASAVQNPGGLGLLQDAAHLAGIVLGLGTSVPVLDDLQVGSPLLRELAAAWREAQADPHRSPLASGTRVLTVGGSRDLVVPEHRSDLPDAVHVTVPGGHTAMHESEAVLQVVRAFLADQDVPAGAGGWGAWLSPGISLAEQLVGVVL